MAGQKINIAVYTSYGKFLGYKGDTYWTLSPNISDASGHNLEKGIIPERLVKNLLGIINEDAHFIEGASEDLGELIKKSLGIKLIAQSVKDQKRLNGWKVFFNQDKETYECQFI